MKVLYQQHLGRFQGPAILETCQWVLPLAEQGLRAYTIVKAYRQRLHLLDRRTCVAVIAFPSDVVSVATSHPNILWAACQSGSLYRVPIEGNEHARLVQVKDEQHLVATNAGVHCISFFQSHLFACGLLEAITVYSFDGDGVLRGVSPLLEEKEEFVTHVLAVKPNDVLVSLLGEGHKLTDCVLIVADHLGKVLGLSFGSQGSCSTRPILIFPDEIQEIFCDETAFVILGKGGKVWWYGSNGLRRTFELNNNIASATFTADETVICVLVNGDAVAISTRIDGRLQSQVLPINETVVVASGFSDSSVLFLNRHGRVVCVGLSRAETDPSRHLSALKDVLERKANKILAIERLSAALDELDVAIKLVTNPTLLSCSITSDARDDGPVGSGVIRVVISSNTDGALDLSRWSAIIEAGLSASVHDRTFSSDGRMLGSSQKLGVLKPGEYYRLKICLDELDILPLTVHVYLKYRLHSTDTLDEGMAACIPLANKTFDFMAWSVPTCRFPFTASCIHHLRDVPDESVTSKILGQCRGPSGKISPAQTSSVYSEEILIPTNYIAALGKVLEDIGQAGSMLPQEQDGENWGFRLSVKTPDGHILAAWSHQMLRKSEGEEDFTVYRIQVMTSSRALIPLLKAAIVARVDEVIGATIPAGQSTECIFMKRGTSGDKVSAIRRKVEQAMAKEQEEEGWDEMKAISNSLWELYHSISCRDHTSYFNKE